MVIVSLFEGVIIGFLMAVPIGAVGILCIRRTLSSGRRDGFVVGLGGATADLLLSAISVFGIRLIYDFINSHQYEIRLVGGILLLAMGVSLIRARRVTERGQKSIVEQSKVFFSTLTIALTNPLVVFGYAAVMSVVFPANMFTDPWSVATIVVGVFSGSLLWFFTISNIVHRFRTAFTDDKLVIVNRIAGILLLIIGVTSVYVGFRGIR